MEVSGQIQAPYALDRRLGEPQSQSGCCGEEKSLVPARNQALAIQPIACYYAD
jgi:hypothetical protein